MHNLVKLVQASGKSILVPGSAIASGIVRSLSLKEKEAHPAGSALVWLILDGQAQSAIVRERMGFVLAKGGGPSSEREIVEGLDGERISIPRSAFAFAMESERITDAKGAIVQGAEVAVREKRGEELIRMDGTVLKTSLRSAAGVVDFFVKDSADDLLDRFNVEVSEDDGTEEYDDEGNLIVADEPAPVSPARRSSSARPARRKRP
jgi:hypothetical protein